MQTVGEFIRERRLRKGLSARQLAEAAGVSDAHVFYIERGLRNPTFEKLMSLLEALNESMENLLRATGQGDADARAQGRGRLRRIPVITWVQAGKWGELDDSFEPGDADEWIYSDVGGRNVFALSVMEDSMEPEFHEGDVIIISPHVEALPNDYAIIKNPEGECTFKQLKKYGGTDWVLHPLNPKYEEQIVRNGEFRVVGKVVKKEKNY